MPTCIPTCIPTGATTINLFFLISMLRGNMGEVHIKKKQKTHCSRLHPSHVVLSSLLQSLNNSAYNYRAIICIKKIYLTFSLFFGKINYYNYRKRVINFFLSMSNAWAFPLMSIYKAS